MNHLKIKIPNKPTKKRSNSVQKNKSYTISEDSLPKNKPQKIFTYEELTSKLTPKKQKSIKKKFRPKSSSKKSNKKKYFTLEQNSFINTNYQTLFTNSNVTHLSTLDTEECTKSKNKKSKKMENFNKVLNKAKELLSVQSEILLDCENLNNNMKNFDNELGNKFQKNLNLVGQNILPGFARALFLLESKKQNNKNLNYTMNNNIISNNIRLSFIPNKINKKNFNEMNKNNVYFMNKMNKLNFIIGELRYNYIFNEFNDNNFIKKNIDIYFDNLEQLLIQLTQTINEQKELILKQEEHINKFENIFNSKNKKNSNFIQNENNKINYNINLSQRESKNIQENIFNSNSNNVLNLINNEDINFCNSNNKFKQNIFNSNRSESGKFDIKLENNNSCNKNENICKDIEKSIQTNSSLINSGSFFESYKRNKELKNQLNYNYCQRNYDNL